MTDHKDSAIYYALLAIKQGKPEQAKGILADAMMITCLDAIQLDDMPHPTVDLDIDPA